MQEQFLFNCVRQTVNEIVKLIDPATPGDLDIRELRLRYDRALQIQGKAGVGKLLGLTAAELEQGFGPALRRALAFAADDSPHGVDRTIAYLRFLNWAETVADKPGIVLSVSNLPQETPEILAQKQVRALELVLRALVTEHYQSQDKLISRLKSLFKSEVVQQWLRDATKGDILSGTLFSDLASIFTHKQEFQNYEHIYNSPKVLTFLKQRRDTIRYFLEDIRFLRNRIAHHRQLKPAQIELLNIYYEQIVQPVQLIFDQGSTRVNPDALLDTDDTSVHVYFSRLKADMSTLDERTLTISHGVEEIKAGVGDIRRRTGVILAGVAVSVIAIVATFWRLGFIGHDTKEIRSIVENESAQIGNVAQDVRKTKKETSSDPRKELANMGVAWSLLSFQNAVRLGDLRTINLFLAGGFSPNQLNENKDAFVLVQALLGTVPNLRELIELFKKYGLSFKAPIPIPPNPYRNGTIEAQSYDHVDKTMEDELYDYASYLRDANAVRVLRDEGADPSQFIQNLVALGSIHDDYGGDYYGARSKLAWVQSALGLSTEKQKQSEETRQPSFESSALSVPAAGSEVLPGPKESNTRPMTSSPPGEQATAISEEALSRHDYVDALHSLQIGASQGNKDAQYDLALMYAKGDGVFRNYSEAVRWLQMAANQRDAHSEYLLGVAYASGAGCKRDKRTARRWMERAANGGNSDAAKWVRNNNGMLRQIAERSKFR